MNTIEEQILQAVAQDKVTRKTVLLARRYLAQRERLAQKPLPPATEHHEKVRRQEESEREATRVDTWTACQERSRMDHGMRLACEGCHSTFLLLEPHHLVLVLRTDVPEWVMALCAECHRLGPKSAHRAPRDFAIRVVIPWAKRHGFVLPPRKEYLDT